MVWRVAVKVISCQVVALLTISSLHSTSSNNSLVANNDLTRGGVDVPTVLGMRDHAAGVTDVEGECEGRAE